MWILWVLCWLCLVWRLQCLSLSEKTDVPTYYIDPYLLRISQERYRECELHTHPEDQSVFALQELRDLHKHNASEFFRGHELLAYHYFVENRQHNPHYRDKMQDAVLEYMPILSLYWKTRHVRRCDYRSFIDYLLRVWSHIQTRDRSLSLSTTHNDDTQLCPTTQTSPTHNTLNTQRISSSSTRLPIKFFVSSTFNMRTQWGTGMPTALRRGEVYENISALTMSLSVGHYERWPECPDLLRKWWKYVVELPYLDGALANVDSYDLNSALVRGSAKNRDSESNSDTKREEEEIDLPARRYAFLFTGDFALPGPERVCSVRNAVSLLSSRADTLVVNVTAEESLSRGVSQSLVALLSQSTFCLVTHGQSYSTAFFYHAVAHGCVPVVVDDWFTLAFPWRVPYELFVLRINELDFVRDPHAVADYLLRVVSQRGAAGPVVPSHPHTATQPRHTMSVLSLMRREMRKASELLSFAPSAYLSRGDALRVPVWENLMGELLYAQRPHVHHNNVPCFRPYMCKPWTRSERERLAVSHNASFVQCLRERDYQFVENKRTPTKWLSDAFLDADPSQASLYLSVFGENHERDIALHNDGFQASALSLPPNVLAHDTRSHLCKHNKRLIGMYKMVFFMQCVRVLWPLQPGKFRPVDNTAQLDVARNAAQRGRPGLTRDEMQFVLAFHNISHTEVVGGSWTNVMLYPRNETALRSVKTLADAAAFV